MYKQCITEQAARRQREIEHSLLQCMTTIRYEDITISDLCRSMGIPRKAFYRYFSGKDGALYALIDHTIMDFSDAFLPHDNFATLETLQHYFDFWYQKKPLLNALERNDLGGILVQRAIILVQSNNLLPGITTPLSDQGYEYSITFFVTGLISMILQWHNCHFRETPQQMALIAAELLTHPAFEKSKNT